MSSSHQPPTSFSPSLSSRTVSDFPQAEVDAIIRHKRKAREPKACYPCHTRKVKCDRNLPCDGCVKRDHAGLCSYERPSKTRSRPSHDSPVGGLLAGSMTDHSATFNYDENMVNMKDQSSNRANGAAAGGHVSIAREEWENVRNRLREMETTISTLRVGLERVEEGPSMALETGSVQSGDASSRSKGASPEREGIHAANTLGEGTVHLGSRSVLAYILNNKSGSDQLQALLDGGILPKLGLDNESATYPFVDLWSSDMSTFDIRAVCGILPEDQKCRELFYFYKNIAGAIYPVLEDVRGFENSLELLLQSRASAGGTCRADAEEGQKPFGASIAYLGLLFAVLASGCQSSDLAGKDRELTSQVYVCCSYQCLRMTNFLSQGSIEAIQTLLVIGNVLSYNMNPGISYVLLGMTLRMGLALGLHVESSQFPSAERYRRRHVWWSMAWQDSHFSLSYDRPSTTAVTQPDIPHRTDSKPGQLSYFETLCRVISLVLEVVRIRMLSSHAQMSFENIQCYKERMQKILVEATSHLRDAKYCTTITEHLERVVLKLHSSYFSSELCRAALNSTVDAHDRNATSVSGDYISSLIRTVEAYIEMYSISSHASRSWIAFSRAISSAFLLTFTEEAKSDQKVRNLLRQFEGIIAERAKSDQAYDSDVATNAATMTSSPNGVGTYNPIIGTTNPPATISPAIYPTSSAAASGDTQKQWPKSLTKTHRALQKLLAALDNQQSRSASSATVYSQPDSNVASLGSIVRPVSDDMTPGVGSLPPPTPESSTSGEWALPNIIDQYIHPPLWG